jgi:hypothetical protein
MHLLFSNTKKSPQTQKEAENSSRQPKYISQNIGTREI